MSRILTLLPLSIVQALLLAGGQILVKIALTHMSPFSWTWRFFIEQMTNLWWLACGVCFGVSTALWLYILKNYPFSVAYPLSSMAYVFGMLAALWIFHEQISLSAWIGVLLIMAGCYFVAR